MDQFLRFSTPLVLTVLFVWLLRRPAHAFGLVDVPGGRKEHEGSIPLVGGVAMFLGLALSVLLLWVQPGECLDLLVGAGLLVVAGVVDDRHELSPRAKFAVQIVAALVMAWGAGLYVRQVGDLFGFGPLGLGHWGVPFTVVCVLGVINALNMADGIDGLAGGLGVVSFFWFAVAALLAGKTAAAMQLLMLMGAVLGFLVFNLPFHWPRGRAKVFMGDAGSMMLGFMLVWFAVDVARGGPDSLAPIGAVWIIALPLVDMAALMVRRVRKGRSPFSADREHLHHIFLVAGYSVGQTVAILLAVAFLLGGVGVAAWYYRVPDYVLFYAFLAMLAAYMWATAHAWRVMKVVRRMRGAAEQGEEARVVR